MRRKYHRWTEEEDRMIRELYEAGCDYHEMAPVFGVGFSQVKNRAYVLGLRCSDCPSSGDTDRAEFARLMELHTGRAPE